MDLIQERSPSSRINSDIRYAIWLYIFLLIFEGALRKWVLPGLSTPLLVIRDPVAIYGLFMAYQRGIFPKSGFVKASLIVGVMAFFATMTVGHGNLIVATYGVRAFLIHLPFAFLMGQMVDRGMLLKIAKFFIVLMLPMAILIALQFYSPQSAWVNRGVGGDLEGAGFSGALGYLRPPGTFSFTTGVASFFGLSAAFLSYYWTESEKLKKLFLLAASAALVMSIPFSISRALLIHVVIVAVFWVVASARNPKYIKNLLIGFVVAGVAGAALSTQDFFQNAITVLTTRFEQAANSEGDLVQGTIIDRYLGGMMGAIGTPEDLFGKGAGMGSNVGAIYLAGSADRFLIAEQEWPRTVGELGPLLGFFVLGLRVVLCVQLLARAFASIRFQNPLPWLLMSYGMIVIVNGGWAQPTDLGFFTIATGLSLAAFNGPHDIENPHFGLRDRDYAPY